MKPGNEVKMPTSYILIPETVKNVIKKNYII